MPAVIDSILYKSTKPKLYSPVVPATCVPVSILTYCEALRVLAIGFASATCTFAYTLIVPVPVTAPPRSISIACEPVTVTVALELLDVKSRY